MRRVPAAAQAKFLEEAAEAAGDSAFGLHLAEEMDPRSGGLLFYVTSAAPNVEKALALYARYCRIGNESVRLKLEKIPDGLEIEFAYVGVSRHRSRQITEFQLATVVKVCRFVTGLNLRPIRVAFAHARNSDPKPVAQFFGCGVEFAAASDLIAFSREALCAPLVTEDHYLLETLQPFCDEAAKTRHTTAGTLRHAVENEIQRLLPHGNARAETVAKLAGPQPPNALPQARRGTDELRGDHRSSAAQSCAGISEGAGFRPGSDCLAAGLRENEFVPSRPQALDGPLA